MRIILAPVYDVPRENGWRGDSCYLWAHFMAEAASARGWHTTWVMPEVYQPDPIPLVDFLKVRYPPEVPKTNLFFRHGVPYEVQQAYPGPVGPRFTDAIVTNDVYLGMLYQQYFSARQFFEPIPVVSWNGYPTIIDWSETDWVMNNDDSPLFTRALAHCLCTFVACCPYCSGRAAELVRSHVSPGMVRRYLETRDEVMMCADCDVQDALPVEKNEKFSVYWGGRFTNSKGGEESVDQYLKLMMGGRDIDIYLTVIGGAKRLDEILARYGAAQAIHRFDGLPYAEAQRIMRRCHAAVFWQLNPGAAAPYEWMYGGLVVLFKKHHYPEEAQMYPPNYPFLFDTAEECAAMLRWVYEHYDEAQAQLEECHAKEWVKEHTDKMIGAQRILDITEKRTPPSHYASPDYKWYQDTIDLTKRALEACTPPIDLDQLSMAINKIRGRQVVQRNWGVGINGILPLSIYKSFIQLAGWKDDCLDIIPHFVKQEEEHAS